MAVAEVQVCVAVLCVRVESCVYSLRKGTREVTGVTFLTTKHLGINGS